MAGTIKLTRAEWQPISTRLSEECPKSWTTITSVQKREWGFTVRHHKALVPWHDDHTRFSYADQIHLDFYNESMLSWFVLKYVNIEAYIP
jgi:hypothetical protein